MSEFPLLRLPALALNEVLKAYSLREKIMVSLCSKRTTRHITQSLYTSEKVNLVLDLRQGSVHLSSQYDRFDIDIHINSPHNLESYNVERSFSIADHSVPTVFEGTLDRYRMITFWNSLPEGLRFIAAHLSRVFKCQIDNVTSSLSNALFQNTLSGLIDENLEIKKLKIKGENLDEEWLNEILKNLKVTEELTISTILNQNFKPEFGFWPERLRIRHSQWFTKDILVTSTSEGIILENSFMDDRVVVKILEDWKTGRLANLKCLIINSSNFGVQSTIVNAVGIQSDSGVKASIKLIENQFQMVVYD
ncbi:hypothetical protein GCK72_020383 [Caenorhabditis remanei]|uniref:Sdz-33 F-box domain-containing protein n=1 Tax=Caenorhabditis remanei TaxID=31234 RepID=A0A6A5GGJ2_CAERE|nr:hypothetical protein GCK72_020383 [Caenorhabditis remanei]KAF1753826.1 hypothetical protein GCK72_020383 [Caenorhabditis remanei]